MICREAKAIYCCASENSVRIVSKTAERFRPKEPREEICEPTLLGETTRRFKIKARHEVNVSNTCAGIASGILLQPFFPSSPASTNRTATRFGRRPLKLALYCWEQVFLGFDILQSQMDSDGAFKCYKRLNYQVSGTSAGGLVQGFSTIDS
jgi:hypothetical protein